MTGCGEGGGGLAVVKSIMTVGGGMIIIAEERFFSHVLYVHALGDVTREPASCAVVLNNRMIYAGSIISPSLQTYVRQLEPQFNSSSHTFAPREILQSTNENFEF